MRYLWKNFEQILAARPSVTNRELAAKLVNKNRGQLKLFCSESCTAGLIASTIGSVEGASTLLWGGAVVYSNEAKTKICSVEPDIVLKYGAVSEETVEAMLWGSVRLYPVSISLAVSGIAGPGGGSETKPVGLVYLGIIFAIEQRWNLLIREHHFDGDRNQIQEAAVWESLLLLESAIDASLELTA